MSAEPDPLMSCALREALCKRMWSPPCDSMHCLLELEEKCRKQISPSQDRHRYAVKHAWKRSPEDIWPVNWV